MFHVKTLNKISPIGLAALDSGKYTISDDQSSPEAILLRSAKMHDYKMNPELLCIARAGAGTNNIPVDSCVENGIVVFNTPGANAESVKELALCSMLLASRNIVGGIEWVKELVGSEDDVAAKVEKGKSQFAGPELMGKTLGVVGLGAIGNKLANAALGLGMRVLGYDPFLSVESAWMLSSAVIHAQDLESIYANCDYISIHVPYMDETHHMINSKAIAQMKNGVKIINLSRAALINDNDIITALENGKVGKYVTDFPNGKIAGAKNVIAIPHLGASTPESEDNCAIMAAQEIREYLERGNINNSVNLPTAYMEPSGAARICVIHKNVPAIISGVLQKISNVGLNVENMVNKTRGRYSYCMIDVNAHVSSEITDAIASLDGVIRVRAIEN